MRVRLILFLTFLIPALFLSAGDDAGYSIKPAKPFYTIGTASISGIYYPVGIAISRLINSKMREILTIAEPTRGSVANVRHLQNRDVSFALIQSDVAFNAYNGLSVFNGEPVRRLRMVLSLYPEIMHVIVRGDSEINKFSDLAGRRISPCARGSGCAFVAGVIMDSFFSNREFTFEYMKFTKALDSLKNGELDAVFWSGGVPGEGISRLASECSIRLLSMPDDLIDRIISRYTYYSREIIPAGSYKGIDRDTVSLALRATLCSTEDISPQLVNRIIGLIIDNRSYLKELHPAAGQIRLEDSLKGVSLDMLHDGAKLFFKEKGMLAY